MTEFAYLVRRTRIQNKKKEDYLDFEVVELKGGNGDNGNTSGSKPEDGGSTPPFPTKRIL